MISKPKTTTFKFILNNDMLMNNLDHFKLNDEPRFHKIIEIGKKLQSFAKDENLVNNYQIRFKLKK